MTLVATLMGNAGVIVFADTQEVVQQLSKKTIDKLIVYDPPARPFRFAIAGATEDASYVDNLQSELAATLLALDDYDLKVIKEHLSATLVEFHTKHIWPQQYTKQLRMEYRLSSNLSLVDAPM